MEANDNNRNLAARRPLTAAYGLVLLVWLALFVVRPALALQLLRERRADSPLPRLRPATTLLVAG